MKIKTTIQCLCGLSLLFSLFSTCYATENDECMECHNDESLARDGSTGMKEMLYVDDNRFKYSVHNVNGIGCADCHDDIGELNYDNELPHKMNLDQVSCDKCHGEISDAYQDSVHKKAAGKGITIPCYACHEYHYTTHLATASVSERQNNFCRKCHDPNKFHDWLPQKETHFAFVECTVCHAPESPRHINLKPFDLVQGDFLDHEVLVRVFDTDFDGFMDKIDRDKNGSVDNAEFMDMVLILRQWDIRVTFHGELVADIEPSVHNVNRGAASKDCAQCHTATSPYFKDVRMSLNRPDGSVDLHNVDRSVLETYHVEFNALGSTRVRLLDKIGIALLIGGLVVVVLHLGARILTAPMRRKKEDDAS